jgi:LDH2 family malate/lactate/ureidoglycolate dehydrogenase
MQDERTIAIEDLEAFCADAFAAMGVARRNAQLLAGILVEAELRGHASHGVRLVAYYAPRVREGVINPKPKVRMLRESPISVLVDADYGFGGIACTRALERCLIKAGTSGIGVAGVFNSSHLFIPAHYVLRAARQGYIAICTSVAEAVMPATGGLGRMLGNNPWAFGVPAGDQYPVVLDIAPSASFAKVRMHAEEDLPLPEGWALDKDGNSTTDPQAALIGSLLPLGDHKGYGLAMVSELLAGVLSGNDYGPDSGQSGKVGHFLLVMDPSLFMAHPDYARCVTEYISRIKASPRRPGVDEIFYPGERAGRLEREARACGTQTLPRIVWEPMQEAARELGLELPLR